MVLASTIDPLRYASDDRDPTICQRHFPEEPALLRRTISRAMTDESFPARCWKTSPCATSSCVGSAGA